MITLTRANLLAIAPGAHPDILDGILSNVDLLTDGGFLDDALRAAHFFAQAATETAGFTTLSENLNYTTAARIAAIWPSKFKNAAAATPYVRQPQKRANYVYAGRLGNGNEASGDGWNYRGSGMDQTTGRAEFEEVAKATGTDVVKTPDLLRTFPLALKAATIYWLNRNLLAYADADDLEMITRKITGSATGLATRKIYLDRAKKIAWGETGTPATGPIYRVGMAGDEVWAIQTALKAAGFSPGVVDGKYGPDTLTAVSDYQKAKGLLVDGVVGPNTWAMLMGPAKPDMGIPISTEAGIPATEPNQSVTEPVGGVSTPPPSTSTPPVLPPVLDAHPANPVDNDNVETDDGTDWDGQQVDGVEPTPVLKKGMLAAIAGALGVGALTTGHRWLLIGGVVLIVCAILYFVFFHRKGT